MAKHARSRSPMGSFKRPRSILSPTASCSSEDTSASKIGRSRSLSTSFISPESSTSISIPANKKENVRQESQKTSRTRPPSRKDFSDSTPADLSTFKATKTDLASPTAVAHQCRPKGVRTPTLSPAKLDIGADNFPIFQSGNVFIECDLVTPPKRWRLHSAILERNSAWFRSAMHGASQNGGDDISWRLRSSESDEKQLVLKPAGNRLSIENKKRSDEHMEASSSSLPTPPASATSSHFPNNTSTHAAQVEIYNQIFGAMYSVPLTIPATSVSDTLSHCDSLLRLSDHLSITPLISTQISTALKFHRHDLYSAISRDPARFLLLSIQLQDTATYTESLIHIVGTYPSWPKQWTTRPKSLPPALIKLIERKASELDSDITKVQRDLLLLTINNSNDQPMTPSALSVTEFNTWFVVGLFRDTLVREFNDIGHKPLKRGELFRAIGKGGDAYMPYEEMRALVAGVMPCVLENLKEDLHLMKEWAKGYVKDVVKNRTLVDVESEGIAWLTCVQVGKGDIFWEMEGQVEGKRGAA